MKVTNKKERRSAILRFAGLYLLGLAIPVFIIISSMTVRTVDGKDSAETLSQLRKRDEAFREVHLLSMRLIELQKLRQNEKYDEMRLAFQKSVDELQNKFLSDTVTYGTSYQLAGLLRSFHKEFEKDGAEFQNMAVGYEGQMKQLRDSTEEVIKECEKAGSGSGDEAKALKLELLSCKNEAKSFELQLKTAEKDQDKCAKQLDKLSDKCRSCADMLETINASVNEIESRAKDISKPLFSGNKDIKKTILAEVSKIKTNTGRIKTAIAP